MPEEKNQSSFRTMIGGQALIEGIMMMGPDKKSIVVRKSDGELEVKTSPRKIAKERHPIVGWPLIRGVYNFGSSMYTGMTALMYSAEFFPEEEEEEPSKFETWLENHIGSEKMSKVIITFAMLLGVAFSVFLFIMLPTLLSGFIAWLIPNFPLWGISVLESITRIVIFLGYLILCSKMEDIKRVFSYHGAEHKAIFCYEQGLEMTVENVRIQKKHHPRCGTSFLFVVIVVSMLVSILVFTPLQITNTLVRTGLHLLLLPIIVSLTWELNRYVGGHDNWLCRTIRRPGMFIQRWTTFEPDDSMIEVAIVALNEVLPEVKGKDRW